MKSQFLLFSMLILSLFHQDRFSSFYIGMYLLPTPYVYNPGFLYSFCPFRLHYAGFVEVKEDEEGSIGNTKCCFVSNRIRKWIYNSVLYAHRQKVHQAFAMYYERFAVGVLVVFFPFMNFFFFFPNNFQNDQRNG